MEVLRQAPNEASDPQLPVPDKHGEVRRQGSCVLDGASFAMNTMVIHLKARVNG